MNGCLMIFSLLLAAVRAPAVLFVFFQGPGSEQWIRNYVQCSCGNKKRVISESAGISIVHLIHKMSTLDFDPMQ